ncbi:uncharacterized protein BP01DRAFT_124401 [Aspergillus saccharolyticus JOP 1030-1]|uniref:Uncharacterized protein n=1 Tax=Aspergillus saccharolyticus JOP 1030-1 TaxID=1450539 RepID=A0A318Z6B1_9EURO|nr:hypothetical protein BP01DRAFT_124401 [Aspergillus saccharolyticus JOP 1030-1]PYH42815.1 hypothetical protein BP01DRAFT_124401 [Aspergillus saccharolyticus JOP 1030-1]
MSERGAKSFVDLEKAFPDLLVPESFNWSDESSDEEMYEVDEISTTSSTETLSVSDEARMEDLGDWFSQEPLTRWKEKNISSGSSLDWTTTVPNNRPTFANQLVSRLNQDFSCKKITYDEDDCQDMVPLVRYPEETESPALRTIRDEIDCEFHARRVYVGAMGKFEPVHHFNWLGDPVSHRSDTSPAVSLFVQLTDPKVPKPGGELRLQTLMKNAMAYIDPVILLFEDRVTRLPRSMTDLIEWASTRTFKFYSPHGHWIDEPEETDDFPIEDPGNAHDYMADDFAIGSGFVQASRLPSSNEWLEAQQELFIASEKTALSRQVRNYKAKGHQSFKPSPLRNEVTYETGSC